MSVPDTTPRDGAAAPGRDRTGWTLFAGAALALLGWRAPAQDTRPPAGAFAAPSFATADSNGSMIAVTGIDITGSSLLYVVDTERQQLSVYQATGGGSSTSGVRWIGARRLDLDLQVDGWNDKSELGYKELREQFSASGVLPERSAPDRPQTGRSQTGRD